MAKCTSTGEIYVSKGASLVIEDSRVVGYNNVGVICYGSMKATRCTVENGGNGVHISGEEASAELVDCAIRNNRSDGLLAVEGAKVTL